MKLLRGFFLANALLLAQNYYHPTTGVGGTYSGGCQIHTCSGNYYDNGGPGSNYSNSINWIYQTFCPNNSTQCLRVSFSSFDVESGCFVGACSSTPCCYDILRIQNGPAQNGPVLWQGCGTGLPPTITSTDASGCLTFRFCSDGSVTRPGWAASFTCVNCSRPAPGNSDCQAPTPVCSNGGIADNSNGPGVSAQCGGCITNENYTNFYIFQPQGASGTLTLSICPSNGTDDYDFAIWGGFTTNNLSVLCGNLGTPVRCSYAMYPRNGNCGSNTACTGLASGNIDVSEDVCGNGWVAPLSVTAGQYYVLMVNGWTAGAQGYNLTWNLPSGMSLNCTPLNQPIVSFRAEVRRGEGVLLRWAWEAERLAPQEQLIGWAIDRSVDGGLTWQTLAQLPTEITTYLDRQPILGENLYRLRYGFANGEAHPYLTVQRVEWSVGEGRAFSAWYDPKQEAIHIQFHDYGQGGKVALYTIDGRLLREFSVEPSPFLSAMGFPIEVPGTYIVTYRGQSIAVPVVR